MSTQDLILIILGAFALALFIYLSIRVELTYKKEVKRNNDVYEFRLRVLKLCSEYWNNNPHEGSPYEWLVDAGPSYEEMVKSDKPLTLDEWYDKGKLQRIFEGIK